MIPKVPEPQEDSSILEYSNSELIDDMELLCEIKPNPEDGLLNFSDFCRLFQLIKKHLEPRLAQ